MSTEYVFYVPSCSRSNFGPQAIDFAKEQHDDDLWEDLLRYSETRPGMSLFVYGKSFNLTACVPSVHSGPIGERRC